MKTCTLIVRLAMADAAKILSLFPGYKHLVIDMLGERFKNCSVYFNKYDITLCQNAFGSPTRFEKIVKYWNFSSLILDV